jgi:hypothetical protein
MTATLGRTTLATNAATVDRANADGVKLLGFDVMWSLRGVEVERDRLRELLRDHGFERYMPANPPTAAVSFKRAILVWMRRFVNGLDDGEDVEARGQLVEKMKITKGSPRDVPGAVLYALVQRESLSTLRLRYATSHRFYYKPGATKDAVGDITVSAGGVGPLESSEAREIQSELAPIWERVRTLYYKSDLSQIIAEIVDEMDAYQLRDEGGAYHVPVAYADDLDRLARFVMSLPSNDRWGRQPRLNSHAVPDWPATRAALEEQAFDDILGALKEAKWKLGSVRPRTAQIVMTMLQDVRRRADLIAEQVGMKRERSEMLATDIDEMMTQARSLFPSEDRENRAAQREMQVDLGTLDLPEETRPQPRS